MRELGLSTCYLDSVYAGITIAVPPSPISRKAYSAAGSEVFTIRFRFSYGPCVPVLLRPDLTREGQVL